MDSGFGIEEVANLRFMARELRSGMKLVSFGEKKVLGVSVFDIH